MITSIIISEQDFGDGVLRYICNLKGMLFTPFSIAKCSFAPPPTATIIIASSPLSKPIEFKKFGQSKIDDEFLTNTYSLTKEDVLHGLSFETAIHKLGIKYDGNIIENISFEIPDTIQVKFKYNPIGSSSEECRHVYESI